MFRRWQRFERTKAYDLAAAAPLIAWYGYEARRILPALSRSVGQMAAGHAGMLGFLNTFAAGASAAFILLLIALLGLRSVPRAKSQGFVPRLAAFAGTFMAIGFLKLPPAALSPLMQIVVAALVLTGWCGAVAVLGRLGRSFSIMPEARDLVMSGPYALARHPLYLAEEFVIVALCLQHAGVPAVLLTLVHGATQYIRTVYEERVLCRAFPEYPAYRAQTARFLPGVW